MGIFSKIILNRFFFLSFFLWNFDAISLSWLNRKTINYVFIKIFVCYHCYHLDFTSPAILLLDFQTLLPVKSNTFSMKTLAFFFAGITDLMCFIWLVDRLHFLPRFLSFLLCSVTLQVNNATEYTPFIKWCLRAIPIRRLRLHQARRNAETFVSLMTNVKAVISSCSSQYVS